MISLGDPRRIFKLITTTLAILVSITGIQQGDAVLAKPSASKLMTQMFAHYAAAPSVVGTIKMTQSAQGVNLHITTDLQFDRPGNLYIHQVRDGSRSKQWTVTSNGIIWTYDRPDTQDPHMGPNRHVEYVTQNNFTMTLPDFFAAASHSLGDINPILIAAISSKDWLKRLAGQWATLTYVGPTTVNGVAVDEVAGKYREGVGHSQSGDYEAYLTPSGDLLRYVLKQKLAFQGVTKDPLVVTTVWESDLHLGAVTNKDLYKPITR